MSDDPAPPRPSRRWRVAAIAAGSALVLAAIGAVAYRMVQNHRQRQHAEWLAEWQRKQKGLPPSGGKVFEKRLVINVPQFRQSDPRWGHDQLGPSTTDSIGSAGCAVSSCAMVLASYGVDTNPQMLNDFLSANNGFTPEAWLKWEVAATLNPDKVRFVYEDDPSFEEIDTNLERGNPVIIRLRYPPPSNITHFVVICGKDGLDYLIVDPGSKADRGVYPLKDFGSNIEALRYYEPVKKG